MTWLLSRASSLSLSTEARNRYTARSTINAIVTTDVKRMGHMPHPPLWNAVEIAVNMFWTSSGVQVWSEARVQGGIHGATHRHASACANWEPHLIRGISGRV